MTADEIRKEWDGATVEQAVGLAIIELTAQLADLNENLVAIGGRIAGIESELVSARKDRQRD